MKIADIALNVVAAAVGAGLVLLALSWIDPAEAPTLRSFLALFASGLFGLCLATALTRSRIKHG